MPLDVPLDEWGAKHGAETGVWAANSEPIREARAAPVLLRGAISCGCATRVLEICNAVFLCGLLRLVYFLPGCFVLEGTPLFPSFYCGTVPYRRYRTNWTYDTRSYTVLPWV